MQKVFIGADHRGYELKEKIKAYLTENNIEFEDLGAYELDKDDDYPVFASRVAEKVSENENTLGVVLCGSGVGVNVVANKYDGIRASMGLSPDQVEKGREDDNMNVLVLAADFSTVDDAIAMLDVFLSTEYEDIESHARRLEDIKIIEENN